MILENFLTSATSGLIFLTVGKSSGLVAGDIPQFGNDRDFCKDVLTSAGHFVSYQHFVSSAIKMVRTNGKVMHARDEDQYEKISIYSYIHSDEGRRRRRRCSAERILSLNWSLLIFHPSRLQPNLIPDGLKLAHELTKPSYHFKETILMQEKTLKRALHVASDVSQKDIHVELSESTSANYYLLSLKLENVLLLKFLIAPKFKQYLSTFLSFRDIRAVSELHLTPAEVLRGECAQILDYLNSYNEASGQLVNSSKSRVTPKEEECTGRHGRECLESKFSGGMGFRDSKAFNMAVSSKGRRPSWVWSGLVFSKGETSSFKGPDGSSPGVRENAALYDANSSVTRLEGESGGRCDKCGVCFIFASRGRETMAVRLAGRLLHSNDISNTVVEGDNRTVIQLYFIENVPPRECAAIIGDVNDLISSCNFSLSSDRAAHWVATLWLRDVLPSDWVGNPPFRFPLFVQLMPLLRMLNDKECYCQDVLLSRDAASDSAYHVMGHFGLWSVPAGNRSKRCRVNESNIKEDALGKEDKDDID
ncbi:hypothetical protein RHSIM_Rhsim03G0007500 [Rhododendron simsii]|uniref:Uncharacterized protein n=1 Tax=Rhododendron simsii TaxID=118357 RepID=A0A834HAV4_RHOSS|nr:hypothetical protein RHSIM_Rhsim03G0007500 [Rhododendron simsii]